MELTWLGAAGFIVKTKDAEIAFDPFLSREKGASSPFSTDSFQNTRAIFVGHGHFDHTYDIPAISKKSELQVFAPGLTGKILKLRGLPEKRLLTATNTEILFAPLKLRAFHSQHVNFDWPLIVSTAKRCGVGECLHIAGLGLKYPKGLVQTYLFESGGKKVLFASSAGCTPTELEIYRRMEVDYFLAPLQGHSKIQSIAARQTAIINPKVVIPHHHDDFYPPMSQDVSVEIFRNELKRHQFRGDLLEIPLFQSAQII